MLSSLLCPLSSVPLSIVSADVQEKHLLPIRPIVRPSVPQAQGVADALLPENFGQPFVGIAYPVVAADGQDDILSPEQFEPARVVFVGDEIARIVEIQRLVVIAIDERAYIAESAQTDNAVD